jgi:hypothetical protein
MAINREVAVVVACEDDATRAEPPGVRTPAAAIASTKSAHAMAACRVEIVIDVSPVPIWS